MIEIGTKGEMLIKGHQMQCRMLEQ